MTTAIIITTFIVVTLVSYWFYETFFKPPKNTA